MSARCAVCHAEAPIGEGEALAFCGHCGGPVMSIEALQRSEAAPTQGAPQPLPDAEVEVNLAEIDGPSAAAERPQGNPQVSPLTGSTHGLFSGLPSRRLSRPATAGSAPDSDAEPVSSGASSTMFSLEALMRGSDSQSEPELEEPIANAPVLLDLPAAPPIFGASADEALLAAAVPSARPGSAQRAAGFRRARVLAGASVLVAVLFGWVGWSLWGEYGAASWQRFASLTDTAAEMPLTGTESPQSAAGGHGEGTSPDPLLPPGPSTPEPEAGRDAQAAPLSPSAPASAPAVSLAKRTAALVGPTPSSADASSADDSATRPKALGGSPTRALASGKAPTIKKKPSAKSAPPKARARVRRRSARRSKRRRRSRVAPKPPAPKAGLAGAPFDAGAAKRALAGAVQRSSSCRRADLRGRGKVQLTFSNSGRVQSVKFVKGPFRGTSAGRCILERFRNVRVPAFIGESVTVSKSFSMR